MNGRRFAVIALAVAACSTQPSVGSRFNGPVALVSFRGVTRKDASNMRTYIAVASSRGDEVRIVDPADLQPVVSPGSVFPLSIPTAPRPLLVASAPLGDKDASGNGLDLADVLVVVSAGAAGLDGSRPALQLVETWDRKTASTPAAVGANLVVKDSVPLTGLAAGSDVLSMVGMAGRTPGTARILVGASNGQLAVVEFTRATDGSGAVVPGTVTVLQLGFDPLDMAVDPDGVTVYIATRDPIATDSSLGTTLLDVFGVAALGDATTDILAATPKALAAAPRDPDTPPAGSAQHGVIGAPTVAVAAGVNGLVPSSGVPPTANVFERTVNSGVQASARTFAPSPTPLVYAALDPASCGTGKHINCGIVAIDPTSTIDAGRGNLVRDPVDPAFAPLLIGDKGPPGSGPTDPRKAASAQPYRAPMPVPGVPMHISVAGPPASGSQRLAGDSVNPAGIPLFTITPGTGPQSTNAVAMVSSSDGHVYWLDLSRWGPASDTAETSGVFVTGVTAASVDATTGNQLGLWQDIENLPFGSAVAAPTVVVDGPGMAGAIDVWPGFTDADTWNLTYQGVLPALSARPGIVVTRTDGAVFAAIQTSSGVVTTPIADPALGVRDATTAAPGPADTVVLPGCEVSVAAVIPATPALTVSGITFNGGALQLDPSAATSCAGLPGPGASAATTITVRASGLVFSSIKLGYLGRPTIARTTDPTENVFSLAWTATADVATPPATQTRLLQEQRAIERKARRRFYPSDPPCPFVNPATAEGAATIGCYGTGRRRLSDPVAPGPVIRFRVGLVGPNSSTGFPQRDATLAFTTQTGLSQVFRKPVTGGAGPGNVLAFDYTKPDPTGNATPPQFSGHQNDAITFFVPYLDDQVITFSTVQNAAQVTSIR